MYRSVDELRKIACRIWVASILLHHKLGCAADTRSSLLLLFLFGIKVQRACFVMKLGTTTTKNGQKKTGRSIVEFGHLLRRFNMKRGKCPKDNPAALDIAPDTPGNSGKVLLFRSIFGHNWPYYVWQKLEEWGDVPMFGQIWSAWSLCVR